MELSYGRLPLQNEVNVSAPIWMYFKCGGCSKVRKTQIRVEKITVCGSCSHKQTVTRNDRLIGAHSEVTGKPFQGERNRVNGRFIKFKES